MPAIAYAIQLLGTLPSLISAGIDVVDLINNANDALKKMQAENRDPTDSEWSDLNDLVEKLRASRPDV